jgi:hypothetical protein
MWNTESRINTGMFHLFRVFRLIRGVGNTTEVYLAANAITATPPAKVAFCVTPNTRTA